MKERRQHMRVGVRARVTCEIEGVGKVSAVLTDIGLGGARLSCPGWVLGYGTELVVVGRFPGSSQLLRVPATVRWTSSGAYGLQFGRLGAFETHVIAQLVEEELVTQAQIRIVANAIAASNEELATEAAIRRAVTTAAELDAPSSSTLPPTLGSPLR